MPDTFILGIDGLPCWQWRQFADNGVMPFSAQLLDSGRLRPMQSSIPEVSSAAWASIVTGRNPGGHNVFGFTDLIDGSYSLGFTSSRTFRASPFWTRDDGQRRLVLNVPQTWPAQPLNGVLASGFVTLDLDRAVFPRDRLNLFQDSGYRVDADMSLIERSKQDFLDDLHAVLDVRCRTLHRLWDDEHWDEIMFVITGTDRLNHYFWADFEDPASPFYMKYLDFHHRVDQEIERICRRLDDDTTLVTVSDHGFGRQRLSVNVNRLLHDHGYLFLKTSDRPSWADILPETKVFAMDPGRLYIHRADRWPAGTVDEDERHVLEQELTELFLNLDVDGTRLVDAVVRGSEAYDGPFSHRAPDLVLMAAEDVALSGRIDISELLETTPINGKHTFENATFFCRAAEPPVIPETMRVEDVLQVVEHAQVSATRAGGPIHPLPVA